MISDPTPLSVVGRRRSRRGRNLADAVARRGQIHADISTDLPNLCDCDSSDDEEEPISGVVRRSRRCRFHEEGSPTCRNIFEDGGIAAGFSPGDAGSTSGNGTGEKEEGDLNDDATGMKKNKRRCSTGGDDRARLAAPSKKAPAGRQAEPRPTEEKVAAGRQVKQAEGRGGPGDRRGRIHTDAVAEEEEEEGGYRSRRVLIAVRIRVGDSSSFSSVSSFIKESSCSKTSPSNAS